MELRIANLHTKLPWLAAGIIYCNDLDGLAHDFRQVLGILGFGGLGFGAAKISERMRRVSIAKLTILAMLPKSAGGWPAIRKPTKKTPENSGVYKVPNQFVSLLTQKCYHPMTMLDSTTLRASSKSVPVSCM